MTRDRDASQLFRIPYRLARRGGSLARGSVTLRPLRRASGLRAGPIEGYAGTLLHAGRHHPRDRSRPPRGIFLTGIGARRSGPFPRTAACSASHVARSIWTST